MDIFRSILVHRITVEKRKKDVVLKPYDKRYPHPLLVSTSPKAEHLPPHCPRLVPV